MVSRISGFWCICIGCAAIVRMYVCSSDLFYIGHCGDALVSSVWNTTFETRCFSFFIFSRSEKITALMCQNHAEKMNQNFFYYFHFIWVEH